MIHIFIGTKAQYVKMATIIHELERRGVTYNLIDSGQHGKLSGKYRRYLDVRDPDAYLRLSREDIKTVGGILGWSLKFCFQICFQPKKLYTKLFKDHPGICLIHGDTPTTLLSLFAAKRLGIKVLHLESGLRSFSWFHPFPEEIIRVLTMKWADYLFAPNQWSYENILKLKPKGEAVLIEGNTNIDVLRFIQKKAEEKLPFGLKKESNYVVFSIHRAETILRKERLTAIVRLVEKVSKKNKVLFCLHPPTERQLKNYQLYDRLRLATNIQLESLLPYPVFISVISQAYFIVTDGGSVQEESYYLNIPCLVMREHTERTEGLKTTVQLSQFKEERIQKFLDNIEHFRSSDYKDTGLSPSKEIVDYILTNLHES